VATVVQEEIDLPGRDAGLFAHGGHPVQDAFGTVMRGGRGLVPPECTRFGIEQQKVGKCAANVHAQPVTH
jgi:hypothetical protein